MRSSGRTGAGTTTLFHLITGRHRPDEGHIRFNGKEIGALSPYRIVRKGVGRSFQRTNSFPRLSVFENVQVAAVARPGRTVRPCTPARSLHEVTDDARAILEQIGLEEQARLPANRLSPADQKRLEIGVALATRPVLLLLDEPTAGMSPADTAGMVR